MADPATETSATIDPAIGVPDVQVIVNLPAEIVSAIQKLSQQPTDQLDRQILTLLQNAVSFQQAAQRSQTEETNQTANSSLHQEIEQLKRRLGLLEALGSRIDAIEGKVSHLVAETDAPRPFHTPTSPTGKTANSQPPLAPQSSALAPELPDARISPNTTNPQDKEGGNPSSAIASIWMQVQQNDRPPASIPSTLQITEPCPLCQHRVVPFKSSGRIVCIKCGWTDKLGNEAATPPVNTTDIHKLLEQAAIESLENMKPRKRSTSNHS